jgi:pimeloyl-ACP methyl ester carboxylesterase
VFEGFTAAHRGGSGPPLVLLHGFTDTWRTWELVLPALEREREVYAPTLPGHAGGPPLDGESGAEAMLDALEAMLDEAGLGVVDVAGNSLGGYAALALAGRGRARSVVALAPAGGWGEGDDSYREVLAHFTTMQELLKAAAPRAQEIVSSPEGRRRASQFITVNHEHLPAGLLAHQMLGAASCPAAGPLIASALADGWPLDPEKVTCPVRIVWGTDDAILTWPSAAARYRDSWFPHAEWIELEGVGHCPQLDVPAETADLILTFGGS